MEFVPSDELKKNFSVYGHFYNLEINGETFKCRSVLDIITKSSIPISDSKPCAVIVMMNPGSSKPEDCTYIPKDYSINQIASGQWKKDIVPTKPDNAQYQIMRLMLLRCWTHVRILNLSDLRNGNSSEFSNEFQRASSLDATNPHSLTNHQRHKELLDYCSQSKTIIAAWGRIGVLKTVAKEFLNLLKELEGIPLEYPWYRHPSPQRKDQKVDWLKKMNEQLERKKNYVLFNCSSS